MLYPLSYEGHVRCSEKRNVEAQGTAKHDYRETCQGREPGRGQTGCQLGSQVGDFRRWRLG